MKPKTTISETEHRPDLDKLRVAAKQARELAQECYKTEVTGACWNSRHGSEPCLEREHKRLKGEPTLPSGSTMRAYSMFNPEKLCGACLAYWHIEMGAQALTRLAVSEEQIKAEQERKMSK